MHLIEQSERNKDFFSVCEKIKQSANKYLSIAEIAAEAIHHPAQSFYLSIGETGRLLRKPVRRIPAGSAKQSLWLELAHRYRELHHQYPTESIEAIARRIELQPAPRFYMSPKYATRLYYQLLADRRMKNKKKYEENKRLHCGK
jgi:hypothetical protein